MKKYNEDLANIFVDIDDTLTPDLGDTFYPGAIEKLTDLSKKANIIIWSKGELEYINEIVRKSGLQEIVCMCIPKPSLIIDDLEFNGFTGIHQIKDGNWDDFKLKNEHLEANWFEDGEFLRENYK